MQRQIMTFRISELEAERLQAQADALGVTKSAYIRLRLANKPIVKVYRPGELLEQLSRIGNNINQIARKANQGNTVTRRELESLSENFRELRNEVLDWMGEADIRCP